MKNSSSGTWYKTTIRIITAGIRNIQHDGVLVIIFDLIERLNGKDGEGFARRLKKFLDKEPCCVSGDTEIKPVTTEAGLIFWLGTVRTEATKRKFVAKNKFKLKQDGGICVRIDADFTRWFLSGRGKVEDPQGKHKLRYGRLRKPAPDIPENSVESAIIPELGGEAKAETTLTEVCYLIEIQPNGRKGVLLTNGRANIFYVRDQFGVLRVVSVRYFDHGWWVYASLVDDPIRWNADNQVFSRSPHHLNSKKK